MSPETISDANFEYRLELEQEIEKLQAENAKLQNTIEARNQTIIEMSQMLNKLQQERDMLLAFIIRRFPVIKAMGGISEVAKLTAEKMDSVLEEFRLEQQVKGAIKGYVSACKWALGSQYDEEVAKNRATAYGSKIRNQAKGE